MNHARMANAIGDRTAYQPARDDASAVISIALVWFFVRETKGKELERM
jgi:hypothetical protein